MTPTPSTECSKVAVGSWELCISGRAKRVSGSLTITGLCNLTKTASATLLNSNKTAKMAFFNHVKRLHRSVRFQPKRFCSVSGSVTISYKSFRFLRYREVGLPEPMFLKPFPWDIRLYYYEYAYKPIFSLIGGIVGSKSIQDTNFPDRTSENKKSKLCYLARFKNSQNRWWRLKWRHKWRLFIHAFRESDLTLSQYYTQKKAF